MLREFGKSEQHKWYKQLDTHVSKQVHATRRFEPKDEIFMGIVMECSSLIIATEVWIDCMCTRVDLMKNQPVFVSETSNAASTVNKAIKRGAALAKVTGIIEKQPSCMLRRGAATAMLTAGVLYARILKWGIWKNEASIRPHIKDGFWMKQSEEANQCFSCMLASTFEIEPVMDGDTLGLFTRDLVSEAAEDSETSADDE